MLKRTIAILLTIVMCVGVLAGCSGNGGNGGSQGGTSSVVVGGDRNAPLFSEVTDIELYVIDQPTYDYEGSYLDQLLEKQENIRLNITEGYEMDQLIVDQDLPDIVFQDARMWGDDYGPKGAFVNVLDYMDQMPNLKAYLAKYPGAVYEMLSPDGGLYHVPLFREGDSTTYGFIYREDIFEKHSLTFPTTRDEFYNTLKKLKELYPNSYPFVMRSMEGNMQGIVYLAGCFGTSLAMPSSTNTVMDYNHKTGQWYYGPTSEGMKDMVTFLNQLYEEGLLHRSTITMTSAQWTEAFAKGDSAEGVSFIGFDKMDRIPAQLQLAGEALNPEFSLVAGAPIKFNDLGEGAVFEYNAWSGYNYLISATSDNVSNVLAYIDWLYSEEGIEATNWGKEGETFEYDENGNKKWLDSLLEEPDPQYSRLMGYGGMFGVRTWDAYMGWQTEAHQANLNYANQFATLPSRPVLKLNDDEMKVFNTYWISLHDYARGELQKFITGERDISTWNSYVKTAESEAYQFNMLKMAAESAYERMQNEKVDIDTLLNGG